VTPGDEPACDLAVVGGGLAGLVAAWRERQRDPGARVVLLEAGARPGGVVATERIDGFLVERAAASIRRGADAIHALIEELGLCEELVAADPAAAARRFVLHRGRLCAAPAGVRSLLSTPLLSAGAKLRLLAEPFVPARPQADETVAQFVARRCGAGLVAPLLDAVVTGIFAGDVERLEAASAFPRMTALERRHGSLLRGALAAQLGAAGRAARAARTGRPALTALRGGMQQLVDRLCERLADAAVAIRCGARVVRLAREADAWRIALAGGESLRARRVHLAAPAWAAAELLRPVDAALAAECAAIEAAPLAVVAIGVARSQVSGDVDALGFLVPRAERRALLGVLCESSLFPGRAPAGHVLLRAMVGGGRVALPESAAAIARLAFEEAAEALRIAGAPRLLAAFPHRPGIPQYRPGHAARVARVTARVAAQPGLSLGGWSWSGIALDDRAREPAPPAVTPRA